MAAHELAHLRYTQVEAILKGEAKTVALVPSGSTEAHGPHLPLATDSIISEGMAKVAATKLADAGYEAVVFPCLHYAVTDWAADFAGSTGLEAPTAEAMLLQTLVRAHTLGFDAVVLCNAHLEPDNISALRSVAQSFEAATGGALVFPDVTRRRVAQRLTPEFQSGSCHAGSYETSLVLAVRPELVDMEVAQALPEHFVPLHERIAAGAKSFLECGLDRAYCGSPADATAEEGHATFAILAEITVEMVNERLA